jgi:E3 ubiquitin-protein ligase NEDD4
VRFTSAFYKSLLQLPFEMKDLESVDSEMYSSVQQVMSMAPDEVEYLCLCFAIGEVELEPGGMERDVTGENRTEWVKAVLDHHLSGQVSHQRRCIATGFSKVLALRELKALGIDHAELELILSGLPEYDVDDWQANTEYPRTGQLSAQVDRMHRRNIEHFWELMRELTNEEKAGVVRFCTGSAGVPVEGFAGLRGRQARNEAQVEKFKIQKINPPLAETCSPATCGRATVCVCRLPQSHTCFNTLDLPPYPSKAILREKLMTAVEGSAGFGFA